MDRRSMVLYSGVVIGAVVLLGAWAWLQLPADAQVPIHWGPDGQPDGFAGKTLGLFLMPAVMVGVAVLFWFIPVIEPRRTNIEKSAKAYRAIWYAVIGLLGAIQVVAIAAALGTQLDMTLIVFVSVGIMFIVIGNYLPKVRPNYLMGIRTPWTLTSDRSWDRTHRLGGRLFVLEGIVMIAVGVVRPPPESLVAIIIGGVILLLVVTFAYSYRVWKADPNRRPT